MVFKRMSAVIAASLLLVSILLPLHVEAANELEFEELGTHPEAAAQPTERGLSLHDLAYFNGKIYSGYGDFSANTGPIDINPFDIETGEFTGSELTIATEEINKFREIGGKLYAPDVDPECDGPIICNSGYAIGEPWEKKNLIEAVHVFDVGTLNGTDRWMVGSTSDDVDGAHAWRSENGVDGWEIVQTDTSEEVVGYERYYWIATLGDKIYMQANNVNPGAPVRSFDGSVWSAGTTDTISEDGNVVVFEDKIVTTKDGLSAFDGTTLNEVTSFTGDAIDMYEDGGYLYVLRGNGQLVRTQDLEEWQELSVAPNTAESIAVHDGRIYIGSYDSKLYGSVGEIGTYVPEDLSGIATAPPAFVSAFGSQGEVNISTRDVEVDSSGVQYVIVGKTILKINSSNQLIDTLDLTGYSGNPQSVDIGSDGTLYVAYTSGNRVRKFTNDGVFIAQMELEATLEEGEFFFSMGRITLGDDDNIYVVGDTYLAESEDDEEGVTNYSVFKFSSDGTYLSRFGSAGSGNGQFDNPFAVAVSNSGDIYVTDQGNYRIQKFNSAGVYQSQFGEQGSGEGQFETLGWLSVDHNGNVYAIDSAEQSIQKFNSSGEFVLEWGSQGDANGQFQYPNGIATNSSGDVYVTQVNDGRVQKFNSSGTYISKFDGHDFAAGKFSNAEWIAADSEGNVYVTDSSNHNIQKFNSAGEYLLQWGDAGTGNSEFDEIGDIAIDSNDNIYVVDENNNRVQKFNTDGEYLSQFGSSGSGNGEFNTPTGITVDGDNNVYVVDSSNYRIQKFNSAGVYQSQFGEQGSGEGQLTNPRDIAIDSQGGIYALDATRVQKFTNQGIFVKQWGIYDSSPGNFQNPFGIAIDSDDRIYVSDENDRIQRFNTEGQFLVQWGENGEEDNQFYQPSGIAVDKDDNIYVVDRFNTRVQKFAYNRSETFASATGSGDITLTTPEGTSISCADSVAPESLEKQDGNNIYPVGLVNFCLSVGEGSTQQITIDFESDFHAGQVAARKYDANTQEFADIPGASVTDMLIDGTHVVRLVYAITDGGALDQDGEANGEIIDPIGLSAEQGASTETGDDDQYNELADTGQSGTIAIFLAIALVMAGAGLSIWQSKTKQK